MARTPRHPVVDSYVRTGMELPAILATVPSDGSPIIDAMISLSNSITGKQPAGLAFRSANNVEIRGLDTDLCILFLGHWAHTCIVHSVAIPEKLAVAWTLIHRARALVSRETPREIVSFVMLNEARLLASQGNISRQEEILKEALEYLQQNSLRRLSFFSELAILLAQSGRLAELEPSLPSVGSSLLSSFRVARFINCIETGQYIQAMQFAPDLAKPMDGGPAATGMQDYLLLMDLMQHGAEFRHTSPQSPPELDSSLPDWALVLQCLLTNSTHQAIRWARLCEKKYPASLIGHNCIAFNLIRSELAEGNHVAAGRLMEMRRSRGNRHYLDEFFLARIDLLTGNQNAATAHFASVLRSIDVHHAEGRLDFELRLAAEMPRNIILHLTRKSEAARISIPDTKKAVGIVSEPAASEVKGVARILGVSSAVDSIRRTLLQFAKLDVPVLITGETGTGKELVARALHETSNRNSCPFVAINCGAISESLLESELFGHEKGAFTGASTAHQGLFEEAGQGVILLDEIAEISLRLQVALLRVLETSEIRPVGSAKSRKITCRILAATNADIQSLADKQRFRSDILFRLKRLEIHIPPLRDRKDDILPLAAHFLDLGRPTAIHAMMSEDLCRKLLQHPWPGNVRELRNVIERMRLLNSDKLYYEAPDLELRQETEYQPPVFAGKPADESSLQGVKNGPLPGPVSSGTNRPQTEAQFREGRSQIRRQKQLQDMFYQHKLLTRDEVIQALQISPNTATRDLQFLCRKGIIERVQPTASPRSAYFILRETAPDPGK